MATFSNGHKLNHSNVTCGHLKTALGLLLQAYDYACDAGTNIWQFGLEIHELRQAGLTNSDFRWMLAKGYVEQAQEVTLPTDSVRVFRPLARFTPRVESCFVLSESGIRLARQKFRADTLSLPDCFDETPDHVRDSVNDSPNSANGNGHAVTPTWDSERRELRLCNVLVKIFKWPASNQEMVLSVFEEEGWPARIDDPLPRAPEQDPKRRLHDTIKCLNRKQENALIHFRGDGTGEGVIWDSQNDSRETSSLDAN